MAESKLKERPKCLKCGNDTESGFILDRGDLNLAFQMQWIEGLKMEQSWTGGIKTGGRAIYAVVTYRCKECGFLESYATHKVNG